MSELCSVVEAVSGEEVKSQVLMTSNGQQMEPNNIIGAYSVGTVSHASQLLSPYKPSVVLSPGFPSDEGEPGIVSHMSDCVIVHG